ncbi:MAG TPA: M56 family metallopeptidase, partial [Longimicrobiales bacterium]
MAMWMTYAALSGVLFALAAWITESAVRGRGGAARFAWLGGMVLTVALPCLAFLPERETTVAPMTTSSPADVEFWLPIMFEAGTLDAAQPIASSDAPARDYDRALLVAWALMSASLALAFVVALAGLRIRRRAWRSATVDGVDVLVAQDAGPAAVGAFRPRIVLPEWSLTATPAARRLMLEHEMEHVRARDPMVLAGAGALLV